MRYFILRREEIKKNTQPKQQIQKFKSPFFYIVSSHFLNLSVFIYVYRAKRRRHSTETNNWLWQQFWSPLQTNEVNFFLCSTFVYAILFHQPLHLPAHLPIRQLIKNWRLSVMGRCFKKKTTLILPWTLNGFRN